MTISEIATASAVDGVKSTTLLGIRKIAKQFGKNIVLRDISLDVSEGEFLTIAA
jgi:ABC-type transporter Mla maintaining outer membrane lipid asymmetry ATPase subunit MlaF